MRVVHLTQTDAGNGAGAAAHRLHRALLDQGVESRMLAGIAGSGDPTVTAAGGGRAWRTLSTYANARLVRAMGGGRGLFSASLLTYGRPDPAALDAADAVVLHWVTGGFLAPRQIARLRGKRVFWRLSDIWPFSGGCHYPGDCTAYTAACGACPALGSRRTLDLSRLEWAAKRRAYRDLDLTVVAPSRWIEGCARASTLFGDRRIVHIPTGVETDVFRPHDRRLARDLLGLPQDARIVLFGALRSTDDPRKGYRWLREALDQLAAGPQVAGLHLAVFGGARWAPAGAADALPLPTTWIGRLHDRVTLALLYSAADVLVAPFLEDNLPNVVLEAAACGLPVVAFDAGGLPDVVRHRETGWLAPLRDADALAAGIAWVLEDDDRRAALAAASRSLAETTFSLDVCARSWRDLMAAPG